MPWTTDENGERKYKVSLYAKEELPTWGEVYEWLKSGDSLVYTPVKDKTYGIDPYWKVPSLKYKLAIICNQFNKMIFEDGMLPEIKDSLTSLPGRINDIRFVIEPINRMMIALDLDFSVDGYNERYNEIIQNFSIGHEDTPPPIYTIPLPSGERNPFITNEFPRTDINDLELYPLMIKPVINICVPMIPDEDKEFHHLFIPDPLTIRCVGDSIGNIEKSREFFDKIYTDIMSMMVWKIKEYFENGVGWKDENGDLIEKDTPSTSCQGSGVDPAL